MTPEEIAALSDQEIVERLKKGKFDRFFHPFGLGFLLAIAAVAFYHKGLSVHSLFPILLFVIFLRATSKKNKFYKALAEEILKRNSKS